MNPLDEPMHRMESILVSPWPTILKYGGIGSLAVILLTLLNFLFGHEANDYTGAAIVSLMMTGIIFMVYVTIMIYSIKEYRDKLSEGYITLGKGMLISYGSAMATGIMSQAFSLLYLLVLDPDYMNRQARKMVENMDFGPSGSAANMDMYTPLLILGMQVSSFVLGSVVGLVLSLIISAIMKKDRPYNSI